MAKGLFKTFFASNFGKDPLSYKPPSLLSLRLELKKINKLPGGLIELLWYVCAECLSIVKGVCEFQFNKVAFSKFPDIYKEKLYLGVCPVSFHVALVSSKHHGNAQFLFISIYTYTIILKI